MRVFVTGASGYVGTAVISALIRAGHEVTGQGRSDASLATIQRLGGRPVRAELGRFSALAAEFAAHEAVIHAATNYQAQSDREAIDAVLGAARRASGPFTFVYTSGVWVLGEQPTVADESTPTSRPAQAVTWRAEHEKLVLAAASGTLVTAVIRPGMVYGGKAGLITPWFEGALKDGAASAVGTGGQHWAFVHRDDLAELYRLVLERRAKGVFHGVDGHATRVEQAAGAYSKAAGKGAVRYTPVEQARATMGAMADALAMDQNVASTRAREVGWVPAHRGVVEEAEKMFKDWKA
jgi:nucleoside-diphosphate-sugar epimerase